MLVLLFVALWFILRGDLVYVWPCVIVFFSPFSIAITSLEEERANLSAFRTFVWFALVWFCLFLFLLVSGKGCDLWLWHSLDFFSYLLCKQCRSRWDGSCEPSHQNQHCLPFSFLSLRCLPFCFCFSFTRVPYLGNGHIQFHSRKSPFRNSRVERSVIVYFHLI